MSGLLIIAVVLVVLVAGGFSLHLLIANRTKASKGGVEPPPAETGQLHPSAPPLESIEPRT